MKKRLFSILLSLAMVITMMPAMTMTAFADDHVNHAEGCPGHDITFQQWTDSTQLPASSGNYYLDTDVELSNGWNVPTGETNLCLNGFVIKQTGNNKNVITVPANATLNLYDCSTTLRNGYIDSITHLWKADVSNDHAGQTDEYDITGGIITGANITDGTITGSGVHVDKGTFNMTGGNIVGNNATNGGGVYVVNEGGTFNMSGGSIVGNTANAGGGVYVMSSGTFNLTGGNITGNTAATYGGGVRSTATFIMTGNPKITNNECKQAGGGVYVGSSTFTMTGGEITGNNAKDGFSGMFGGGVFFAGKEITLGGKAKITGNTAGSTTKTANNLYLYTGKTVTLGTGTGEGGNGVTAPADGMSVGVTMATPGIFIETAAEKQKGYFSSDNSGYEVAFNNNHLELKEILGDAKIGNNIYETLADALAAAKAGDELKLLADITINEQLNIDKAITLNGNGMTIIRTPNTGDAKTRAGILVTAGATIKNLTVSGPNSQSASAGSVDRKWDEGEFGIKLYNATGATLTDVTVKSANAGIQVNGGSVTMTGKINVSGNEWGGIELCHGGKLDISAATLVNEGETDATPVLWNDDTKGTITANSSQTLYKKVVDKNKDHYYLTGVAKIDNNYYRSLADAIAAAQTGATVELLEDTNGAADVDGKKIITLDLANHTLTLGPAIGSTGTETSGIRVLNGSTLTAKNGTVKCSDMQNDKGKYVRVGFANYGTLTLDDIIMTTSDGATLWTINNRGNLTLKGTTKIPQATRTDTTGNNGCTCAAINMTPYDYAAYDNAVLNVEDSTVNVADIVINDESDPKHETNVTLNIEAGTFGAVKKFKDYNNVTIVGNISGGTFSANPSTYVAEEYSVYKMADSGKYVVSATAPTHSAGMNTWTLNTTGLYEESYVAPPKQDPAPEKIEEATSIDVSKDVEVKKDETGVVVAKTEVSEKVAESIVEAAKTNKSEEVVIAAVAETKSTEAVTKAEVALPVKAIEELAKVETVQNVVIQTNVAEITLDKKTAEEIAKQAPEGATIIVEAVREAEKSKQVAQDIYELKIVAVQSGTKTEIGDFKGGKVTVKVDIPEGLTGKKVACLYRDNNGKYTRRAVTKQDDAKGFFSFTTNHFSDYVVTEEATAQKLLVNQTDVAQKKLKTYASGKIKVSFAKVTYDTELGKRVQTYQIYRSTKKNSGFKKVGTVVNKKKSTKTITYTNAKKLKKGKKYYYKVRGRVKLANGKYAYTQWSKVKTAKCKKSR